MLDTFPLPQTESQMKARENRSFAGKERVENPLARNTPIRPHLTQSIAHVKDCVGRESGQVSWRKASYANRYTTDALECVVHFLYSNGKSDESERE
ncbi:hypothetical protein AVEN_252858-1 [Araneus ventricosus]|uniref:Uncharacterized protein n=1 Tax=Araneus ventricosus TaxID=182803 RepID=A0A4Y2NB29_ARAVE|nr:hypothetical protein AVEN_252858-1 [Araneus ventricosus]